MQTILGGEVGRDLVRVDRPNAPWLDAFAAPGGV
jgi:hypothetical protein